MRYPSYYAAVFAIIHDEAGKILFSRRHNTGHLDGYLSLPAGHIEPGETPTEAMKRELEEELGIEQCEFEHVCAQQSHNLSDNMTYINFYFEVQWYSGIIENREKDKCSELIFLDPKKLEREKVVPYVYEALQSIERGVSLSELTW